MVHSKIFVTDCPMVKLTSTSDFLILSSSNMKTVNYLPGDGKI